MPKRLRVTGLPEGSVDVDKQELNFTISVSEGKPTLFVAKFGVAAQVIGALGRMLTELRAQLDKKGGIASVAAEQVAAAHIQKDRWTDVVLVQLITPRGVPYSFAVRCQDAADIADRLKIESAKGTQSGIA